MKPIQRATTLDEAFHHELWAWYWKNRKVVRANYTGLTQRFLDYNAPLEPREKARFLRTPQSEALEMYVFLKERLADRNAGARAWPVYEIFEKWYRKETPFANRSDLLSVDTQLSLVSTFDEAAYTRAFERMRERATQTYGNYIFALTMGTGKTLLMVTCIFYDFLLANTYDKDRSYAHNALIFAPDKTVLATLRRDIEQFDREKVVPREYLPIIDAAEARFLEEDGATLTGLRERFNIIVSNAQKIILRKQGASPSAADRLFAATPHTLDLGSSEAMARDLFDTEEVRTETELVTNQRYETLRRMKQLGVFIDEAHHAFGAKLLSEMDPSEATSQRRTVDQLAADLAQRGTRVVGCYNFTGTPYAKGQIFPEVVYAYGLKKAISNNYLKEVEVQDVDELKVKERKFLKDAVTDFLGHHGHGERYEGMLAKLAIFVPAIKDIDEVRALLLDVLADAGISGNAVLVNVGDSKHTSQDDIRAFNLLDTPESEKQFILLVGKGKEGWNCRSLFGVVLYRKPKSKVFVLQATMRCLRAIDMPPKRTGRVYLSTQCKKLLDEELYESFQLTVDDLKNESPPKERVEVRLVPPPRVVRVNRPRHIWELRPIAPAGPIAFKFTEELVERYHALRTIQRGLRGEGATVTVTKEEVDREDRPYSALMLAAEIARYLNRSPIEIHDLLSRSAEGLEEIVGWVSRYNDLIYDHLVPTLFEKLYRLESWDKKDETLVELVRPPRDGDHYVVHASPDKIRRLIDPQRLRSFHLDHYCFDSGPELRFFDDLLKAEGKIETIYFTGMLTHGQTDFFIPYTDPITNTTRHYYPDFVVKLRGGDWFVIEVKGDNKVDDPVVKAKTAYAEEMADQSRMHYRVIRGSKVMRGESLSVFNEDWTYQRELEDAVVLPFRKLKAREVKPWKNALPLFDVEIAAGAFSGDQIVDEDGHPWVEPLNAHTRIGPNLFVAQVRGESMNKRIANETWCIWRRNPGGSLNGKIVIAQARDIQDPEYGQYTVKLYRETTRADGSKRIELLPDSKDPVYQPMVFENLMEGQLTIVAELVEVLGT